MDKNEYKANQSWLLVFVIITSVVGTRLGGAMAPDANFEFLYGALFGGAGALVGAGVNYLLREKSKGFKIASAVSLLAVGTFTLFLVT